MIEMIYEKHLWNSGYQRIACCDEVGRGCLFGSVIAAAVVLKPYDYIDGVRDSKKLSPLKREKLFTEIMKRALAVGVGEIGVDEIERINIRQASRMAMKKAVLELRTPEGKLIQPDSLLIDAESIDLPYEQQSIVRGEDHVHGIAAASIVAKVIRDEMCQQWHMRYPIYGVHRNKGYGTKEHREALKTVGPCAMHRRSFLGKILPGQGEEI